MSKVRVNHEESLAYYKLAFNLKNYIDQNCVIICIGTDKCIGDCLGPLIGTFLKEKNIPLKVFGTIDEPIHALNIQSKVPEILNDNPNSTVIGIDACLGSYNSIGDIQLRDSPVNPGKGVGKNLPTVGDISIVGIVDSSESSELFSHRNIRLDLIMKMAHVIADGILHAYYMYCVET